MAAISNKGEEEIVGGGGGWPARRKKANTVFQKTSRNEVMVSFCT